jgi:hypothetical protein
MLLKFFIFGFPLRATGACIFNYYNGILWLTANMKITISEKAVMILTAKTYFSLKRRLAAIDRYVIPLRGFWNGDYIRIKFCS